MRHLDLFAGIGGFSLAAQWMGWTTVAQVEWDEWCQKVLAKNFPDALRFGDIVEFNKKLENGEITADTNGRGRGRQTGIRENDLRGSTEEEQNNNADKGDKRHGQPTNIGHIDIITGGFPCQPFSHAGKRKGTDDSRYLWPAMLETIRRVKPSYVVGENVAGLVSMENGKTLDRILSDLEDEGYTTKQVIIPACAVGAWHRRDRIWIIAHTERAGTRNNRRKISDEEWRSRQSWGEGVRQGNGKACTDWISSTGEDAPDTRNARTRKNNGGIRQGVSGVGRGEGSDNEDDANCKNQRLQGRPETGDAGGGRAKRNEQSERYRQCPRGENGQLESRLGGMAYGLPYWVDGYWDREPEGVPRVATGVKDRVNRLKGLGNAIVPQVIYEIFKAIEQYDNL